MTDEEHLLTIGRERIAFRLRRSGRKSLGISVDPEGEVLVTAPEAATLDSVTTIIRRRAAWILDKQAEVFARPVPTTPRRYVPGETHLFLGRQYRLSVEPATLGTRREGDRIIVGGVSADEPGRIRNRLNNWYAREARDIFTKRLAACFALFRGEMSQCPKLRVSPLEKRWGSYIQATHTLILNRTLVQVSLPLIDYVVIHELCHAEHQDHGRDFVAALNAKLPDWPTRKEKLEFLTR